MEKTRARQMLEILRAQGIDSVSRTEVKLDIKTPAAPVFLPIAEKLPAAEVKEPLIADSVKKEEPAKKEEKTQIKLKGFLYRKLIGGRKDIGKNNASQKTESKQRFHIRGLLYDKLHEQKSEQSKYPRFAIEPSGIIPVLSKDELKEKTTSYPLIKPYAYADIRFDQSENSLVYFVVEPELNDFEKHVISKLKEGLLQVIDISLKDIKKEDKMIDFLEGNINKLLDEYDFSLNEKEYLKIMYFIYRDFVGLNDIEPLLCDPYIEDIGCDGFNVPLYVVHQRYGSLKTNIIYPDENELKEFVTKLAERCDRFISYAEPMLDGALPDGTRVHASLAGDVTTRGPTFSIRKFRDEPFTPADIIRLNTASPELLAYIWFVVENGVNILIVGGVATGKTSLLNCISMFIPSEAKIVSIEDTRELSLPHENWIPGVARTGFTGTGVGEVTMFDLLKESFRQNPDYLVVGEIRGKEAYVMFQSMASGHPSISTMHSGSVDDVVSRLRTEPISLPPGLIQLLDLVIIMVHAREKGKSARRVKEIVEIQSIDSETGFARTNKVFTWTPSQDTFEYHGDSWVLHKISTEKGITMNDIVRDIAKRKKFINWMVEKNITNMNEIAKYIETYRRSPEKINSLIGYE
ncbi:MAG: type II/IV secretion system ATPase subunit [Candidatus Aenigmatarchaeota archaeon]